MIPPRRPDPAPRPPRGVDVGPEPVGGWVWAIAGVHLVVLLALAGRHGFHRDELYFLEAARHPALGYVDQPPLVPMLARLEVAVMGSSAWAIRVVPALVSATSVVLGGLLAREFGGGRVARALAAGSVATAGYVLGAGHLLSTSTTDVALWLVVLVVVARMLRTGDPRWWLAVGAVAGVAMWNKQLIVVLVVSVVLGVACDRRWSLLTPTWVVAGGLAALVLAGPVLWWQATNGWPQAEMARALSERVGAESRVTLLPLQVLLLGPPLIPLAISGSRWLRAGAGRVFRPLLWAYGVALVVTFVSGGRPYYPLPLGAALVVAGAVAGADRSRAWFIRLLAINGAASVLLALPVLPPAVLALTPINEVNDTLGETIGWPELADQVATVVDGLPAPERATTVVVAGSYGEAGALDRFGPPRGLPEVFSGHNSYWGWRRPPDGADPTVTVGLSEAFLADRFAACEVVARVDNAVGIDNEARGEPIAVCRGPASPWVDLWPSFRHVD